ncbi:unnamed protein product [Linum trigynum]|uniref:Uncharacterized protein n=1 Tax=Linum trigynum TaxID=586398 RepID=A0AAV2D7F1_9ROSI
MTASTCLCRRHTSDQWEFNKAEKIRRTNECLRSRQKWDESWSFSLSPCKLAVGRNKQPDYPAMLTYPHESARKLQQLNRDTRTFNVLLITQDLLGSGWQYNSSLGEHLLDEAL